MRIPEVCGQTYGPFYIRNASARRSVFPITPFLGTFLFSSHLVRPVHKNGIAPWSKTRRKRVLPCNALASSEKPTRKSQKLEALVRPSSFLRWRDHAAGKQQHQRQAVVRRDVRGEGHRRADAARPLHLRAVRLAADDILQSCRSWHFSPHRWRPRQWRHRRCLLRSLRPCHRPAMPSLSATALPQHVFLRVHPAHLYLCRVFQLCAWHARSSQRQRCLWRSSA